MARWYGKVGYAETLETSPGIWEEVIVPREYSGDMLNLSRSMRNANGINDNIEIGMELSIVADPYAFSHFSNIRYIEYMGIRWKVRNVSVNYPRLQLSLGEEYVNGKDPINPTDGS